jgi:predicted amidophosphoribosyltransferase
MHDEYESHYVRIKKPTTSRLVGKREVRFICARCHKDVTEWRYPGPLPQYCAECGPIVKREKTAARTRRARGRKKERAATASGPAEEV